MPRVQPDQIKVGAGPVHRLPKYGAAPGYELEASRISDDGTDISLSSQAVGIGDFALDNNGTRLRLNDSSKTVEVNANRNDPEHSSIFEMGGSPGIAVLTATEGAVASELSLAPAASEVRLGFTENAGVLRLKAAATHLQADLINIGNDGNSTIAVVGKLTRNGIQVGTATYIQQLAQTASIAPADILINGIATVQGLYRLSYYLVTTTAGTSGAVKATFDWTDAGAARSVDSATINFGTLADPATGTLIIQSTGVDPIRYSTSVTDAVDGPEYALYVTLERLR